jgi:hypothetical protein
MKYARKAKLCLPRAFHGHELTRPFLPLSQVSFAVEALVLLIDGGADALTDASEAIHEI